MKPATMIFSALMMVLPLFANASTSTSAAEVKVSQEVPELDGKTLSSFMKLTLGKKPMTGCSNRGHCGGMPCVDGICTGDGGTGSECTRRSHCGGMPCEGGRCVGNGNNTGGSCSSRAHCGGMPCDDGRCSGNDRNTGGECTRRSHCGGMPCVDGRCY